MIDSREDDWWWIGGDDEWIKECCHDDASPLPMNDGAPDTANKFTETDTNRRETIGDIHIPILVVMRFGTLLKNI